MRGTLASNEAFLRTMRREADWLYTGRLYLCDRCGLEGPRPFILAGTIDVALNVCEECETLIKQELRHPETWLYRLPYDTAMTAAVKAHPGFAERGQGRPAGA